MIEAKVLLFNPPTPDGRAFTREGRCTQEAGVWGTQWPPLSLAAAAALLRRDGHRVTLRDYPASGLNGGALAEDIRRLQPAFAIWSTGTPTLRHDLSLARLIREHAPETVTAVIGTHVTVRPEEALGEAALDVVIRGEPEGVIRDLCRSSRPFAEVVGVSLRDRKNGAVRNNPDAVPLAPEAIPAADWDGLNLDDYRLPLKGRRFLMVAPVRGCPWRCSFCTAPLYYGSRLRRRPVADVIGEMAGNVARYGIREFFIWADTFTADRRYVQELCRAIVESGLRVSWTCNSRVDTIDEETLRLMKAAGLWMISYGLESGSDKILAASGKGITVAQSREAVAQACRLEIRVAGHFMFGLPGETEETMAETLALALTLPLDIAQFYAAAPFPGTALYDEALDKGWLRES
ncbi:MAG: B12-binding domain-containing radical SAM protein, partial [Syntrophales bacterium]